MVKKSIDMPDELFDEVMEYAHKTKIYKFTPTILVLLRKALDGENKDEN